jgi:beta propeller repeat protein
MFVRSLIAPITWFAFRGHRHKVRVAAAVLLTAACSGDGPTPPARVASVTVSVAASSIVVGSSTQATAILRDTDGNILAGRSVSWSSANPSIATVSEAGVVTGAAHGGPVIITATAEGISGGVSVTVTPVPVASVSVTIAASSIMVGVSAQATATLRDDNGNVLPAACCLSSSNAAVASVSVLGVVTGTSPGGPVAITATSEGVSGSVNVTVTVPTGLAACLDLIPVGEPGCPVTSAAWVQARPGISGNRVVWQDFRNGVWAIFMLDIATLAEKQLTPPNTENILPVIDDDWVVYVRVPPAAVAVYRSTSHGHRVTGS